MARTVRFGLSAQMVSLGLGVAVVMTLSFVYLAPYIQQRLERERREQVRYVVQMAAGILEQYVQMARTGRLDRETAQAQAKAALGRLRFGEDDYFWINDVQGLMLMHPTASLVGQNMSDWKDAAGQPFFRELLAAAARGGGFVPYLWPKPGHKDPVPKISYVLPVRGWDWVVGSGLYTDDVVASINRILYSLGAMVGVKFIVVVATCFLLGQSLARPVVSVLGLAMRIEQGDLTAPDIEARRADEVGLMAKALNSMKHRLKDEVRLTLAASHLAGLAAREIAAGNQSLAQRVQERAATSQQMAASLEELSASVNENTEQASRANEAAARAAEDIKALAAEFTDGSDPRQARLQALTGEVWQLATTISDLAGQSWSQSVAVSEISQAFLRLDALIQEDAALVEQVSVAADNLKEEADNLRETMKVWKLDE